MKDICEVHNIPFQFRQLMHNLIGNALKFSNPDIPPHIIIESHIVKYDAKNNVKLPTKQDYCHISVSDNGIGFEKEFSGKIFELFQKIHGREEYAGTGIGLNNHNGIISTTGEVNKGTTFDIYIPASIKQ